MLLSEVVFLRDKANHNPSKVSGVFKQSRELRNKSLIMNIESEESKVEEDIEMYK